MPWKEVSESGYLPKWVLDHKGFVVTIYQEGDIPGHEGIVWIMECPQLGIKDHVLRNDSLADAKGEALIIIRTQVDALKKLVDSIELDLPDSEKLRLLIEACQDYWKGLPIKKQGTTTGFYRIIGVLVEKFGGKFRQ